MSDTLENEGRVAEHRLELASSHYTAWTSHVSSSASSGDHKARGCRAQLKGRSQEVVPTNLTYAFEVRPRLHGE